jgi:hypothetical protein
MAMHEHWCNDVYRLATIALRVALQDQADVLALIADPADKPTPHSRTPNQRSRQHRCAGLCAV